MSCPHSPYFALPCPWSHVLYFKFPNISPLVPLPKPKCHCWPQTISLLPGNQDVVHFLVKFPTKTVCIVQRNTFLTDFSKKKIRLRCKIWVGCGLHVVANTTFPNVCLRYIADDVHMGLLSMFQTRMCFHCLQIGSS